MSPHRLLLLAAALGLAAGAACTSSSKALPIPHVHFDTTVDPVAQNKGANEGPLTEQGNRIATMITEWYQAAFVDPGGWKDPSFGYVTKLFTDAARDQVRHDIASLTIDDARNELERVVPQPSSMKVSVYADATGETKYATAAVLFRATGLLKGAKHGPLQIVQQGDYYLRKNAGDWTIFSYTSREHQTEITPKPAKSP